MTTAAATTDPATETVRSGAALLVVEEPGAPAAGGRPMEGPLAAVVTVAAPGEAEGEFGGAGGESVGEAVGEAAGGVAVVGAEAGGEAS